MNYLTFSKQKNNHFWCGKFQTHFSKRVVQLKRGCNTATSPVGFLDSDHLKSCIISIPVKCMKCVGNATSDIKEGIVEMLLCKGANGLGMCLLFSTNHPRT